MNAPLALDWTSANQQLLIAEFARLRLRLQTSADQVSANPCDPLPAIAEARQALRRDSAIDWLSKVFGLSDFERDLLLLCAGVEMDGALARACTRAQGDASRPWVSFSLALSILDAPHWSALTPQRPLRRWRLLELDDSAGLTGGRLRIDERVLHFLGGINELDGRLVHLLRPARPLRWQAAGHAATTAAVLAAVQAASDAGQTPPIVILEGDDPPAQEDLAARCAEALDRPCLTLLAEDIPGGTEERSALITLWQREARLLGAALLVRMGNPASAAGEAACALVERVGGLCLLACPNAPALTTRTQRFAVDKPGSADRLQLWATALGLDATQSADPVLERAASHFRLGSREVQAIAQALTGSCQPASLWECCRRASRGGLDHLAQRIETRFSGFDDGQHQDAEPMLFFKHLVLPPAQLAVLRQIAAQLRHGFKVQEQWGFAHQTGRGLGLTALFAGESGTGKTLAAEVLAHTLQLDLYRIDLSAVVSKYIGETEKNLRKVFDAAEDCGALLLFDEADALFGKRTEVKDSHDRHANIEVSYLLQRMEAYHGLAVLTTNLKSSLDPAFLRRLRFVVQFPFPDQAQRVALWQRAFPSATQTRGLDLDRLSRLSMTGGSIRNIALNAAFLAAEADEPVTMAHLLQAAHAEASKRERPLTDAETRGWA